MRIQDHFLKSLAILVAVGWTYSIANAQDSAHLFPHDGTSGNDSFGVGYGFDPKTPDRFLEPVVLKPEPVIGIGEVSLDYEFDLDSATREEADSAFIAASLQASYNAYSLKLSAQQYSESKLAVRDNVVRLSVIARQYTGKITVTAKARNELEVALNAVRPGQDYIEQHGTHYVTEAFFENRVRLTVEARAYSQGKRTSTRKSLAAAFAVKTPTAGAQGTVEGEVTKARTELLESAKVRVLFSAIGGNGLADLREMFVDNAADFPKVIEALKAYFSTLVPTQPGLPPGRPYSFVVAKIPHVDREQILAAETVAATRRERLRNVVRLYVKAQSRLAILNRVAELFADGLWKDSEDAARNARVEEMKCLTDYVEYLDQQVDLAFSDPVKVKFNQPYGVFPGQPTGFASVALRPDPAGLRGCYVRAVMGLLDDGEAAGLRMVLRALVKRAFPFDEPLGCCTAAELDVAGDKAEVDLDFGQQREVVSLTVLGAFSKLKTIRVSNVLFGAPNSTFVPKNLSELRCSGASELELTKFSGLCDPASAFQMYKAAEGVFCSSQWLSLTLNDAPLILGGVLTSNTYLPATLRALTIVNTDCEWFRRWASLDIRHLHVLGSLHLMFSRSGFDFELEGPGLYLPEHIKAFDLLREGRKPVKDRDPEFRFANTDWKVFKNGQWVKRLPISPEMLDDTGCLRMHVAPGVLDTFRVEVKWPSE